MRFWRKNKNNINKSISNDIKPNNTKQISFFQLYTYAQSFDYLLLFIGVIGAIIAGAAQPLMAILFGRMIDVFTNYQKGLMSEQEFQSNVNEYSLYFVYLAIGIFIATYMFMSTFIYVGQKMIYKIRHSYLNSILRQDVSWFDTLGAGEITTRITSDTNLVLDGVSEKVALVVQDLATFASGFVIAFITDWLLTLIVCCVVPCLCFSILFLNYFAGKYTTKGLTLYSLAGTLAEEAISSIRTITAFNRQNKLIKAYNVYLLKAEKQGIKKAAAIAIGVSFLFFSIYCGYALAFYAGGTLILQGRLTSGKVINVFMSILIGAFSLANVAPNLQAMTFARGAGAKIFEAINRNPEIDSYSKEGLKPQECYGDIEFKNVRFAYPSRKDVVIFENYSLKIEKNTSVALIGSSGSGKSTIVQLLERFYNPDSGEILLDNIPIRDLNLRWLRQQIGLVSQEPSLFIGTIAQNIESGLIGTKYENLPLDEKMDLIIEACKKSNAHDFISSLPMKYETEVGERGFLLSGGQKQRIAIARAIIKNPKILLLDEATSALDTKSEGIVQDALDKASKGRTTITVAHRLSTIRDCDKIVVMDRGVIVEMGNHTQLMQNANGTYHKLVRIQDINKNNDDDQADGSKIENSEDEIIIENYETEKNIDMNKVPTKFSTKSQKSYIDKKSIPLYRLIYKILKLNSTEKVYYVFGSFGAIAQGCAYPIFGIFFSNIIVAFSKTGSELRSETNFWALMFLVIAIGLGIGNVCQALGFNISAEKLTTKLRQSFFESLMKQEVGFFDADTNSTGSLISQIASDAQDIQGISGSTLGLIMQIIVNLLGCIIVGLIYGWKLALVVIACLPILLSTGYLRIAMIQKFQQKNKQAHSKSAEIACEAATSIRTIAALTKEKQVCRLYEHQLSYALRAGFKNAFISSSIFALSQGANFLVNALAFWYGSTLFKTYEYNLSNMFTVYMSLVVGTSNASRIFAYIPDVNKARNAAESIFKIVDRTPLIDNSGTVGLTNGNTKEENNLIKGHVVFDDVEFSYPTRKSIKVLKGISFEARPGQFVALVGPSGCGKSTTISLIERFYDINKGRINIDNINVKDYELNALRNNISLVSQEPSLYDMTIKENILFGLRTDDSQQTQQDIESLMIKACKESNIHDFIMSLPNQYNTNLGGKGSQLSGGQKQRIAIARALIRNPSILLLDEATSALDAQSEKVVQEALDRAAKGRTTIAIAHRLSTIQKADVILVFKNGYIVERGNHSQLLQKKGLYYEMVQEQVLDKSG